MSGDAPATAAVTIGSNGQPDRLPGFGYTSTAGGQITIPAGCAGLYAIKVTPEQAGWQRGTVSEYNVADIVEIRTPGAVGAISVYTTAGDALAGSVQLTSGSAGVLGTGPASPRRSRRGTPFSSPADHDHRDDQR